MKKLNIRLLVASLFSAAFLNGQNSQTPLDSALVACYPFSGNASDFSGNGLHGSVNNASLTTDRFNNTSSAYYFSNSANANIQVSGFSTFLNGTGVSISFWTSKSVYETTATFLMSPDNITNRLCIAPYYGGSSSSAQFYWDCGNISPGSGRMFFLSGPVPGNSAWDHWVLVSSQTGYMKAYKNGSLVATKTSASTFSPSPSRTLLIGGGIDVNNGSLFFTGKIDDIRIYKRILLPGEVTALYNMSVTCVTCSAVNVPSNMSAQHNFCIGTSATLSAAGSPSVNWFSSATSTLSLGNGNSFVTPTQTTAGTYTYFARAVSSCTRSAPLAITFTVHTLPNVIATAANSTICSGQSTQLMASGGTSYTWHPGGLQGQSININPLVNTVYTVAGSIGPCTNTAQVHVSVTNFPTVSITGNATVCKGSPVSFTASGANSYQWNNGATTSTMVEVPLSNTNYTVTGTVAGTCQSSAVISVSIQPLPIINISSNPPVMCNGQIAVLTAFGASSFTWSNGFNSNSTIVSPTSTATYSVRGTDFQTGCVNSISFLLIVEDCTGIIEKQENSAVRIYPNPSTGKFTIELSKSSSVTITNILGEVVYRSRLTGKSEIDISSYNQGVYLLSVNPGKDSLTFKIVKE